MTNLSLYQICQNKTNNIISNGICYAILSHILLQTWTPAPLSPKKPSLKVEGLPWLNSHDIQLTFRKRGEKDKRFPSNLQEESKPPEKTAIPAQQWRSEFSSTWQSPLVCGMLFMRVPWPSGEGTLGLCVGRSSCMSSFSSDICRIQVGIIKDRDYLSF